MRWTVMVGVVALCIVLPGRAAADSSFVNVGLSPVSGPIFVPAFDTGKGTLNSVEVTITGAITVDFATMVNPSPAGPLPVALGVSVDQDFGGGSQAPFTWLMPSTFSFTGLGSGAGEIQQFTQAFNYSLHFNSSTDLGGLTSVSSTGPAIAPGLAFGTVAGFTSPILPFLNELVTMEPGSLGNYGGTFLDATEQGNILIEYDYTPAPPPTVPASEPGTLLLLGSGILGLAACLRARL